MKRFLLSAFSVVLATAAVAPTAQALPKLDSDFTIQTLRLREFDARNKSDESPQPYYPQTSTQTWSPDTATEQEAWQTTPEAQEWEAPEAEKEVSSPAPSLAERRHQLLDRS